MENLKTNGYVTLDEWYPALQEERNLVWKQISSMNSNEFKASDGQSQRLFYHVPYGIVKPLLNRLLECGLKDLLRAYMKSPRFHCASIVYVPARSYAQIPHKDHARGTKLVTCVALSLKEDDPIRTWFRAGTHLFTELQSQGYREMHQVNSNLVLYDTQIDHASAKTGSHASNSRLFFSFVSSSTKSKKDQRLLLEENAIFVDEKPIKI